MAKMIDITWRHEVLNAYLQEQGISYTTEKVHSWTRYHFLLTSDKQASDLQRFIDRNC